MGGASWVFLLFSGFSVHTFTATYQCPQLQMDNSSSATNSYIICKCKTIKTEQTKQKQKKVAASLESLHQPPVIRRGNSAPSIPSAYGLSPSSRQLSRETHRGLVLPKSTLIQRRSLDTDGQSDTLSVSPTVLM